MEVQTVIKRTLVFKFFATYVKFLLRDKFEYVIISYVMPLVFHK